MPKLNITLHMNDGLNIKTKKRQHCLFMLGLFHRGGGGGGVEAYSDPQFL